MTMLGILAVGLGLVVFGPLFSLAAGGFALLALMCFLHYMLWGWWLGKLVQYETEEENSWDIY